MAGLEISELRQLYERFAPVVHRRARSLLGDEIDAWDVVHDVFQLLVEKRAAFRREAQPMTYVYRVTTNVCLNRLRSARRATTETAETAESVPSAQGRVEARQLLVALASRVSDRSLQVAALHYVDGLPQEEISRVLGVARKTVQRDLAALAAEASALSGRSVRRDAS